MNADFARDNLDNDLRPLEDDEETVAFEDMFSDMLWPFGFYRAVSLLRNVHGDPINSLFVHHDDNAFPFGGNSDILHFPEFVTLLGPHRPGRGDGLLWPGEDRTTTRTRAVRALTLRVDDWQRLSQRDVVRLFQYVLPGHPTLERITISATHLPARCLRFLTEAIPVENSDSVLSTLGFVDGATRIEQDTFEAILDMMHRNTGIPNLTVDLRLDAKQSWSICQALSRNTNLRSLSLTVPEIFADTLDWVATSSLQHLDVRGSFSEGAVLSFVTRLRNNQTLESLRLDHVFNGSPRDRGTHALMDFARKYNYTLVGLYGDLGSNHVNRQIEELFRAYMTRNDRIRRALEQLQDPDALERLRDPDSDYFLVVSPRRMPGLLGLVSDIPTVLYRVLKMGYANVVSDLVAAQVVNEKQHCPPPPRVGDSAEVGAAKGAAAVAVTRPAPGAPCETCQGVSCRHVSDSVLLAAHGFREAVRLLEDVRGRSIDLLYVFDVDVFYMRARVRDALSFPRFVSLLEQRGDVRVVREIKFKVDWRGLPEEEKVRLFRDVLPAHLHITSYNVPETSRRMAHDPGRP